MKKMFFALSLLSLVFAATTVFADDAQGQSGAAMQSQQVSADQGAATQTAAPATNDNTGNTASMQNSSGTTQGTADQSTTK